MKIVLATVLLLIVGWRLAAYLGNSRASSRMRSSANHGWDDSISHWSAPSDIGNHHWSDGNAGNGSDCGSDSSSDSGGDCGGGSSD